ncbi:MAG: CPBP family intramembrane glutamic endopeptidase [Planctomycetota bacterium]
MTPTGVTPPHSLPRRVAPAIVLAALLLQAALTSLINLWLFPAEVLNPIAQATKGLLMPTLVANWILLGLVIGGVVMGWGRLRWRDLDLDHGLRHALLISVAVWVIAQLLMLATGTTTVDPRWSQSPVAQAGNFLAQALGNALYEETLFRAFLIWQVAWWLSRRSSAERISSGQLSVAVIVSQVVFALQHIPNRIMKGAYSSVADVLQDQTQLFLAGVVFAILYVRTRNLWLCVFLHALVNRPSSIFTGDGSELAQIVTGAAPFTLALAMGVAWLWRTRVARRSDRGQPA